MTEDEHALIGAYTLNAVDDTERTEFEHHLAHCPQCTADLPALREVIAVLARSTATAPPDTLVDTTVTRARTVPQERTRQGVSRFFRRRRGRGSAG